MRLTPRRVEGETKLSPDSGTVMIGSVRLDVPAHSVPVEKKINLVIVSAQGLAEPLPMGWSPVLVVDLSEITFPQPVVLTADPALAAPTTVTVKNMPAAFLPVAAPEGFRPVCAVELSLGGAVLTIPASLSVPASATVTARLRATHPATGDEGTAEQTLTAGALITADINLQPTEPRVVGQSPSSGATNVPLATRVQIIFSEAVSADSLTPQTFYVTGVAGTITLSADGLLAEFKPAQDFASSHTFTITVKGTIKDLRGTPMGTDYTSTFTTRDIIPPTYDLKKRLGISTNAS